MVSSLFDSILKDFELFFNCPLRSDANNSCKVEMGFGIAVQIELNPEGQILIGSALGELPAGAYRDRLIRQALKSNYTSSFSSGVFGYGKKSNQLICFLLIPQDKITEDNLFKLLPPFIEKAKSWKEALEESRIPVVEDSIEEGPGGLGLFGLIH